MALVTLNECEECLVPEDRKFPFFAAKSEEVKHDGIDDSIWHRVLFVEENSKEDRVGAAVLHLGNLQHDG